MKLDTVVTLPARLSVLRYIIVISGAVSGEVGWGLSPQSLDHGRCYFSNSNRHSGFFM